MNAIRATSSSIMLPFFHFKHRHISLEHLINSKYPLFTQLTIRQLHGHFSPRLLLLPCVYASWGTHREHSLAAHSTRLHAPPPAAHCSPTTSLCHFTVAVRRFNQFQQNQRFLLNFLATVTVWNTPWEKNFSYYIPLVLALQVKKIYSEWVATEYTITITIIKIS